MPVLLIQLFSVVTHVSYSSNVCAWTWPGKKTGTLTTSSHYHIHDGGYSDSNHYNPKSSTNNIGSLSPTDEFGNTSKESRQNTDEDHPLLLVSLRPSPCLSRLPQLRQLVRVPQWIQTPRLQPEMFQQCPRRDELALRPRVIHSNWEKRHLNSHGARHDQHARAWWGCNNNTGTEIVGNKGYHLGWWPSVDGDGIYWHQIIYTSLLDRNPWVWVVALTRGTSRLVSHLDAHQLLTVSLVSSASVFTARLMRSQATVGQRYTA